MPSGRARVGVGILSALVVALGSLVGDVVPTPARAASGVGVASLRVPGDCPRTRAIGAILPGMTGIGWTTVHGDRPEPFRVRILGTLRDGIGPGRDLVVIKVSDLPGRRVVRVGGGIWSGMSGSPVYIRGRLAGAVSYSLSEGPSPVGGMTPARYMERLADVPAGIGASGRAATADREVVRVTGALAATVAESTGRSALRTASLRRLGLPVAASSGVGGRRSFVTRQLRRRLGDVRVVSTGATSASAGTGLAAAPHPGQNVAGVIARGDVTLAAVGTVTEVCRGRVIAFGHPMSGEGSVAFGAARASAVTIVDGLDPYKLANVGRTFGTLDVDRLVGVRAIAGRAPRAFPITAHVRSRTTGRTRTGRTVVSMPSWIPAVAADHLMYDIQAMEERTGPGTATLAWTIQGTRLDTGATWTLRRADVVTDDADVAYASALRLYLQLDTLVTDPSAAVRLRSVSVDVTITRGTTIDAVRTVEVSRNGGPWQRSGPIAVAPGDTLRVRVGLRPRNGRTYTRVATLSVPPGAAGDGIVQVTGGASMPADGCDPVDGLCPDTFGGLLDALRDAPRGDDLEVSLVLGDGGDGTVRATDRLRLGHMVSGERRLRVTTD